LKEHTGIACSMITFETEDRRAPLADCDPLFGVAR
jgi:hypothetical protein